MTGPVLNLLDSMDEMTSKSLTDAQAMVANISDKVQGYADQAQSAIVGKIDDIQTKFFPKNATKGNQSKVQQISDYAYYVSAAGAACFCCEHLL